MEGLHSVSVSSSCEEIIVKLQGLHLIKGDTNIVYTEEASLPFFRMDIPTRIHYGNIYVLEDIYLIVDNNSKTVTDTLQNCDHQETKKFVQFLLSNNISSASLFVGERQRITYIM